VEIISATNAVASLLRQNKCSPVWMDVVFGGRGEGGGGFSHFHKEIIELKLRYKHYFEFSVNL